MKGNYFFFVLVAIIVALVVAYSFTGSEANDDYVKEIISYREKKDKNFKKDEDSPLSKKEMAVFEGLSYFPPNPVYKVEAKVTRFEMRETIRVKTSQDLTKEYLKFAKAKFTLEGQEHELLLLKLLQTPFKQAEDYLFIAFTDATSAVTTYGAGRYIDIPLEKYQPTIGKVTIDFNLAYNPYCAYNDIYDCPIPPQENHLPIAIEAGEKDYVRLSEEAADNEGEN